MILVRAARYAAWCRERHRPLDWAARFQAFSRPRRTGALVFDAPTSARIEGGSARSGRIMKPPGTSSLIYRRENSRRSMNRSAAGVDRTANIEGGVCQTVATVP